MKTHIYMYLYIFIYIYKRHITKGKKTEKTQIRTTIQNIYKIKLINNI